MDHFNYQSGKLFAENVAIENIAQEIETPFYCYSYATLSRHFNVFKEPFSELNPLICYAVKANSNIAILRALGQLGAGADVVSEGELRQALKAGIAPEKIVFTGVGKTYQEIKFALEQDIFQLNVESLPELDHINKVAGELGKKARIAFRVNPDVDAKTHEKITTGKAENKFGIDIDLIEGAIQTALSLDHIHFRGLSIHIGSQLTDLEPYEQAFTTIKNLVEKLRNKGIKIDVLDLGGGLGIPYEREDTPLPQQYADLVKKIVGDLDCQFILEPGRLITGNAGVLVTKILYVKQGKTKDFIIVDAAMNDLLRPSLYDAYHNIIPIDEVENPDQVSKKPADIVGPICETGDVFAKNRHLPNLDNGQLLAIRGAGAYGAVMSSTYNTRLPIPEVFVSEDKFSVIRKRITFDDLINRDIVPEWL